MQFNVFNLLDVNPLIGGFVTAKSATMFYGGFETNIGPDSLFILIYLHLQGPIQMGMVKT